MAKVIVTLSHSVYDGMAITFIAPCDCTEVDGLQVVYNELSESSAEPMVQAFAFKDTHGNDLAGLGNLFSEGAYVKAILDTTNGYAYLQNADTNGYLEARLTALGVEDSEHPGCYYRMFNGVKEWINPPMVDGVEYRLTKRYKGKPVYAMSLDFGALPNTGSATIAFSTSGTKVDEYLVLDIFAVKPGNDGENIHYKLPFYNSSGEIRAFYRTMGARSIWIGTLSDLSSYNGRIYGEYTKV